MVGSVILIGKQLGKLPNFVPCMVLVDYKPNRNASSHSAGKLLQCAHTQVTKACVAIVCEFAPWGISQINLKTYAPWAGG